ncbi:MAG TPA: amidase [Candidatus Krumholzibacteria bacterium]|nr:amidase [Candidatus Krumholzibacteria bacterium]HPD70731.1 amidase [Candidatus Krumholzibacteria bacterium]HRY39569.1 amidase [Candidatus Krumholzibacteria bacterium]
MRSLIFVCALLIASLIAGGSRCAPAPTDGPPDDAAIRAAAALIGLDFDRAERDSLAVDLADQRESYDALRANVPDNAIPPALRFDPLVAWPGAADSLAAAARAPGAAPNWRRHLPAGVERPADPAELAWLPLPDLAALLVSGQTTSEELTTLALARLREHGPRLECVVTLLDDRALARARAADRELAAGRWRGPLHGIPCGIKDLLAVPGHPTTWGAEPYRDQVRPELATVVARLDTAGAVVVAKLTLGALAWGDVWFGGRTRNPWNLEEGSSGSSAGSAAAVAAGLVPFAIGTETWGSIVSPCTRCGATGLRPTFGRVSRHGAMSLSWSMDKIGPIARTVEGCAMVLDAIRGPDGHDPTVIEAPFAVRANVDPRSIRVGYLAALFTDPPDSAADADWDLALDRAALDVLRGAGFTLVPVALPPRDPYPLAFILSAEAAAAFQDLTLTGRDDLLVRQVRDAWPNVMRAAQFIPAVEYLQANRQRLLLMEDFAALFAAVDVYVTPSFGGDGLLMTNLTGHPQLVLPDGFTANGSPRSLSFVGRLYGEAELVAVARAYQDATDWHVRRPPGF